MSSGRLEDFGAYQKSLVLFGHVVEERTALAEEINRILSTTINRLEG